MKIEDARKLFGNCKMYVGTRSEEVQNKLFSLGFKWKSKEMDNRQVPRNADKPFLYISNGIITYGESFNSFTSDKLKEVYVELFLNVPITSSFRPFSNKKECLNEMVKHEPFGLVKRKINNGIGNIIIICDNLIKLDNGWADFETAIEAVEFLDGTPFGVKEG